MQREKPPVVTPGSHTGVPVQVSLALLPIHLPTNVPVRAREDGQSTWALATHVKDQGWVPGFCLAQPLLLQPFEEWTSWWKETPIPPPSHHSDIQLNLKKTKSSDISTHTGIIPRIQQMLKWIKLLGRKGALRRLVRRGCPLLDARDCFLVVPQTRLLKIVSDTKTKSGKRFKLWCYFLE